MSEDARQFILVEHVEQTARGGDGGMRRISAGSKRVGRGLVDDVNAGHGKVGVLRKARDDVIEHGLGVGVDFVSAARCENNFVAEPIADEIDAERNGEHDISEGGAADIISDRDHKSSQQAHKDHRFKPIHEVPPTKILYRAPTTLPPFSSVVAVNGERCVLRRHPPFSSVGVVNRGRCVLRRRPPFSIVGAVNRGRCVLHLARPFRSWALSTVGVASSVVARPFCSWARSTVGVASSIGARPFCSWTLSTVGVASSVAARPFRARPVPTNRHSR